MNLSNLTIAILGWLATSAIPAQECGTSSGVSASSTESVGLRQQTPKEAFYLRVDHYAILVARADLIRHLKLPNHDKGPESGRRLLAKIRKMRSMHWPVDAFALAFEDPLYLQPVNHAFVDALQSGAAAVVDVFALPGEAGRWLGNVSITTDLNGAHETRTVCSESGERLLKVVDSVE